MPVPEGEARRRSVGAGHGSREAWDAIQSQAPIRETASWAGRERGPARGVSGSARGACYTLNSAVLTAPGEYRYRLLDVAEARAWWRAGPVVARIGDLETRLAVARILDVDLLAEDWHFIRMELGDSALVLRILSPPGGPVLGADARGAGGHQAADPRVRDRTVGARGSGQVRRTGGPMSCGWSADVVGARYP